MILDEPEVRAALQQAWRDSWPGTAGGHEEGGFVLQDPNGELSVLRWLPGEQSSIALPAYADGKIGVSDIVATFHTHPNTTDDYLQEPGETDKRAVRDDSDLKGAFYEGEYVISQETIYLIAPNGQVSEIGQTRKILQEERSA